MNEQKNLEFELLELKVGKDDRTIEGYGSVFGNIDNHEDIVLPGAFKNSLAQRTPAMLWQHRMSEPIGVWNEVREDAKGLYVKGTLIDTVLGGDTYKLAKAGAVKGMSIGYTAKESEWEGNIRKLKEVKLYEVSLVTFPANELATVTSVKSRPETIREFEAKLRDSFGFSREEASRIALDGYKAFETREASKDAEPTDELMPHVAEFVESLQQLTKR